MVESGAKSPPDSPGAVTPHDLHALIGAGQAPVVVDVRTAAEYAAGHVPGALNLPLASVWKRASQLPTEREQPMIVYCGHGPRARLAAALLRYRGFRRVVFLQGHMTGWRRAGLPEEHAG
ncbi:MAG TPA: rhodanese-like domain-containing protein [Vicinamibacterales bacterium]|nr:rhodanese-like domain-containing protein [Vicinamibacterales bacterium]